MYPPTQARLEELLAAHRLWEAADRDAVLQAIRDRVRGIAVSTLHGCPAALIEALPRVEIIACFGIGFDAIDLAAAKSCGIRVINTPNVVTDDTADIALSLILAVERRIAEGDRFVRRGDWLKGELPFGRRLGGPSSASWGSAVSAAQSPNAAKPSACRSPIMVRAASSMLPIASLPTSSTSSWSDILVVSCPGGAATKHLVSRAVLEALGPAGTIVNIARLGRR